MRRRRTLFIGAVAAVAVAASVALLVDDDDGDDLSSSETFGFSELDEDAETATTTRVPNRLRVQEAGFSLYEGFDETWATAGAIIVNPGRDDYANVQVVFTLEAAGAPVVTQTASLELVPANSTVYADVEILDDVTTTPDSIEVSVITDEEGFFDPDDYVDLPLSITGVSRDEFSASVRGTLENPTSRVIDGVSVRCVLLSGGTVVGGISTYADTLPPDTSIAWQAANTLVEVAFDDARCFATASVD